MASFANYQPQGSKVTAANLDPAFIATEMLPNIPRALTWREAAYKYKLVIVSCVVGIFAVFFISFFTAPVSSLNNNEQDCDVVESFDFLVQCEDGAVGYCLEHEVAVPNGNGLVNVGILQGFDLFTDLESTAQINCAVSNCTEDPLVDVDIDNLPATCAGQLEELNVSAAELNDEELLSCVTLLTSFTCVEISNSDSVFKSLYFDLQFNGEETAISLSKQPSPDTVIISTVVVFLVLFAVIVLAIFDVKRYKGETLDDITEKEELATDIEVNIIHE